MTPGHRPWKKSILTGGALSAAWWPCPLFTWSNSISLALNLFILIWTTPPGLNVTSAIPPFICSVGPGNQFMLLDPDIFFAPFFVVGSSNFSSPLLIYRSIYSFSFPCHLKMAWKPQLSRYSKGQEEKTQAALLWGPWWKHTRKTEDWPFSSGGYDEMYCGDT